VIQESHRRQHAPRAGIGKGERGPREHAEPDQRSHLERELGDAAYEHAPRERHDRRIDMRREEQRSGDDCQIEQHRSERRDRKAPVDVEHAAGKRRQRDEEDVRKHDADHLGGQLDLARCLGEAAREQIHEPRRRQHAEQRDEQQDKREQRPDPTDQRARRIDAALPMIFGEDRHERLRKRAFGEQPAQEIRQTERCFERVHLHAGAESRRFDTLPNESSDAGQQCHPADGREGAEKVQDRIRCAAAGAAARSTAKPLLRRAKSSIICGLARCPQWERCSSRRAPGTAVARDPPALTRAQGFKDNSRIASNGQHGTSTQTRSADGDDAPSQRRPQIHAPHRRQEGQEGDFGGRQGDGRPDAAGIAGRHRSDRGQEDRPQEPRIAHEIAARAGDQGDALRRSLDNATDRAPDGALVFFNAPDRRLRPAIRGAAPAARMLKY
jgi:hypothetical protein